MLSPEYAKVLLKFLEIIFKTLAYLFVFCAIMIMPLTLWVKVCMLVLAFGATPVTNYLRRKS